MAAASIEEIETYLTFTLGDEMYAVNVRNVREVLDVVSVTKVPRTPEFMRGVINLRGSVVPVVDMRLKFGMERTEESVNTCIIVMEINLDGESTVIGAMADSVKEVFDLEAQQIEPPPRIGTRLNTEFIEGMGKYDDEFIIILNIDKVFSADELALVGAAGEGTNPEEEQQEEEDSPAEEKEEGQ